MATKQLFQILLKNRDGIKKGITKVQDIVTEYLSTTGARTISPDERFTINKEFSELAPSNVVDDVFGDFQGLHDDAGTVAERLAAEEGVDVAETILPTGNVRGKINYPAMEEKLGVKLRGNETFEELLEIEKNTKGSNQGLGSLYPKGEPGQIFDIQNDKRMEVAEFMKAMRAAGIKNEDVMNTAKITDIAEGKRAATSLARAAEMNADTAIKQELLANLDDDIANYGPDWWKGMGYNEGPMGRESVGNLLESITTDINNGVIDDLIARGMDEDKAFDLMRYIGRDKLKYDPKGFITKIVEELEMNNIKYDMTFWDNYTDEILTRIQKPEPRFADGGLV